MARRLYVFKGSARIGFFNESDLGGVTFTYDENAPFPISLSLPRDRPHARDAAINYLEGLLPDDGGQRLRMMDALGSPSDHPFDLLDCVDTAGGLTYSLTDEPAAVSIEEIVAVDETEIAARIVRAAQTRAPWWVHDGDMRFSLAGTQGKFTLTRLGDGWYLPSASLPSTHIFKPEIIGAADSVEVECLTMDLAELCGVDTPRHGVFRADDAKAYYVARFDRELDGDVPVRLHCEDLSQSLGISRDLKYDVSFAEYVGVLRGADPTERLVYDWIAQYAFNVYCGNNDGHAKNYSIFLEREVPALAPIYDAVSTVYWPEFSTALPIEVNGLYQSNEVTYDDWARAGELAGLDGERVSGLAVKMALAVQSNLDALWAGGRDDVLSRYKESVSPIPERFLETVPPHIIASMDRSPERLATPDLVGESHGAPVPNGSDVAR